MKARSFVVNNKSYCISEAKNGEYYFYSPGAVSNLRTFSLREIKSLLQREANNGRDLDIIEDILSVFSSRRTSDVLDSFKRSGRYIRKYY